MSKKHEDETQRVALDQIRWSKYFNNTLGQWENRSIIVVGMSVGGYNLGVIHFELLSPDISSNCMGYVFRQ